MLIHIHQSKLNGTISGLFTKEEVPSGEYYPDCDEDAFLVLGDFPEMSYSVVSDSSILSENELIPVVAQDLGNRILMQAFTNKQSLELTLQTGFAHYFSRSRNKLWKKGEESGHLQTLKSVVYSKENHFLVYKVVQIAAACHTNYYSCFYRKNVRGIEKLIYSEKFNPEATE